jgi:hypothetical protein
VFIPKKTVSGTLERAPDFTLFAGDTYPVIEAILGEGAGDLRGATVRFAMRRVSDNTPYLIRDGAVIDPAQRLVRYAWLDGDTRMAGDYHAQWHVVTASGGKATFPVSDDENERYLLIRILEAL